MLEGEQVTAKTQHHLDRCLTCRSCETTCPSGVKYGHLVELARPEVDRQVRRGLGERFRRWLIKKVVPYPKRFAIAIVLGQRFKPFLPRRLAELVPNTRKTAEPHQAVKHPRTMLIGRLRAIGSCTGY